MIFSAVAEGRGFDEVYLAIWNDMFFFGLANEIWHRCDVYKLTKENDNCIAKAER